MRFERPRRRVYLAASLGFWILGMLSVSRAGQPAVFFWWALVSALIIWPVANAFCFVELRDGELVVRNFFATRIVPRKHITGVTRTAIRGSPAIVAAAMLEGGSKLPMHAIYFATGRSEELLHEAQRRVGMVEAWSDGD